MQSAMKRRTLVDVKKTTFSDAADGTISEVDGLVCREWASIRPLSSRELLEARQVDEEITHRVEMRYSDATAAVLSKDHFLVNGTAVYEIVGTPRNIDMRNVTLEFDVKERN